MHSPLTHRRLRAPREDGGTLVEPPLAAAEDLVAENIRRRAQATCDLQGRTLSELVQSARQELVREAHRYTTAYRSAGELPCAEAPFFLAGHQPQVFHPGVWLKNFALGELARRHGGVAINLQIDSDTIKTATLPVPGGTVTDPAVEMIPLDAPSVEIPYEQRRIVDRQVFAQFGERAAARIRTFVPDPLATEYWPLVTARAQQTDNLGECIAQARHQLEGEWGLTTLEILQSHVCRLEAFHWFTAHLLAHLPRLRCVYNASVAEYRRVNHIRSIAHPVPNLAVEGDWLEAPFWIWQADQPRRRRLFVRRRDQELVLSDRADLEIALPLGPDSRGEPAVEVLWGLESRGIKLRTRALITTMFARLVLGDLFLHGIGGAKYDQLTDLLIAEFFELTPPDFMVVSATVRLPVTLESEPAAELQRIEHLMRDLQFNPQRHLENGRAADDHGRLPSELAAAKERLLAATPAPGEARRRCREIRGINEALQPWVAQTRAKLAAERQRLASAARADRILSSREYGFCLHSKKKLCEMLLAFQEGGA